MSSDDNLVVAARLIAAIIAGDIETVRSIYAPDALIWHNHDRREQSVDENIRTLEWVVKHISNLRYEEIRRHRTEGGFVQQHVLRGTTSKGETIDIPACLVCNVVDGRITRLEEYFDSAHLTPLLAG